MIRTPNRVTHPDYGPQDFEEMFPEARVYQDGVYVDVSLKDGEMVLGFALVEDGRVERLSTRSRALQTTKAEKEAIFKAKSLFPGRKVYSDHRDSARIAGAIYIPRKRNRLAHNIAKFRHNFQEELGTTIKWEDFDRRITEMGYRADKVDYGHWQVRRSLGSKRILNWWPFSKRHSVQIPEINYGRKHCDLNTVLTLIQQYL